MLFQEKINHALELHRAGRIAEALAVYAEILALDPDDDQLLYFSGLGMLQLGDYEQAAGFLEKAYALKPVQECLDTLYDAYIDFGNRCFEQNNIKKAVEIYLRLTQLVPDEPVVYFNLGLAFHRLALYPEAVNHYKKATELNPDFSEALNNLGSIYLDNLGNYPAAAEAFEACLRLKSDNPAIRFNLSRVYLSMMDYKKGFEHYESRIEHLSHHRLKFPETQKPKWRGEEIKGKKIFVYWVAGFGDTFQFARFLPVLNGMGAQVIARPQSELVNLFRISGLNAEIIDDTVADSEIDFDYQIPFMSLAGALSVTENNIPLTEGYLKADSIKVRYFREKYFNNDKFKLGIFWQASHNIGNRSIGLNHFEPLFNLKNTEFYALQKGEGVEQLKELMNPVRSSKNGGNEGVNIHNLGAEFNDFSDTASAIQNLDLLITVDTSVAHLAGALGKPAWVLVPHVHDWRWYSSFDTSLWYKSLKIFKQNSTNDKDELISRVMGEFKKPSG